MTYRELTVPGAWEITPIQHADPRGVFFEAFQGLRLSEHVGHHFDLAQANCSISARGVLRGIHFADVPPGQAKYITCVRGSVLDVAVDLRVGSPSFGRWDSVVLDDVDRRATYLSEGLGHAFFSLEDHSTVMYLCSSSYAPDHEHSVDPFDPALGITWPTTDRRGLSVTPILSDKDGSAPSLAQASAMGLLPAYDAVTSLVGSLRG